MIIGWSTWEPGLMSPQPTSAGGGAWTRFLFDEFARAGHQVMMLQGEAPGTLKAESLSDLDSLDVAVICWRWPMPQYHDRQMAYEWQMQLIDILGEKKVPIIIHDEDHKMTNADRKFVRKNDAIITAPQFAVTGEHWADRSLFFPNPYRGFEPRLWPLGDIDFIYIGNNYERFDQVVTYVKPLSEARHVEFYGNWLERGPGRESPDVVTYMLPSVKFMGRLPQHEVIEKLSQANTTMHFSKDSYMKHGFITIRWAEAVAAGVIGFIPYGMLLPNWYLSQFERLGVVPRDGLELVKNLEEIEKSHTWPDILGLQREFVDRYMRVDTWLDLVEEVKKRRKA